MPAGRSARLGASVDRIDVSKNRRIFGVFSRWREDVGRRIVRNIASAGALGKGPAAQSMRSLGRECGAAGFAWADHHGVATVRA